MNVIDAQKCTGCLTCVSVCPIPVYKKNAENRPEFQLEKASLCFKCGQCMAACPEKAVKAEGLDYELDFREIRESGIGYGGFFDFIDSRRSVRKYQNKPVPADIIEKIINAAATAPMGFPPVKVEASVINGREKMKQALKYMVDFYENLDKWMKNPVMRAVIRGNAGANQFNAIKNHVIPLMKTRLPGLKAGTEDTITRGAPAMIIFHADRKTELFHDDCVICSTYALLAAHSLKLGASSISLITAAFNKSDELKDLAGIPRHNEAVASVILGYPAVKYKRNIIRKLKNISIN